VCRGTGNWPQSSCLWLPRKRWETETDAEQEVTADVTVTGQRPEVDGEGITCTPAPACAGGFTHPPVAVLLFRHHNDLACAESQLILPVSLAVVERADPAEQQSVLQAGEQRQASSASPRRTELPLPPWSQSPEQRAEEHGQETGRFPAQGEGRGGRSPAGTLGGTGVQKTAPSAGAPTQRQPPLCPRAAARGVALSGVPVLPERFCARRQQRCSPQPQDQAAQAMSP